jgi:very-short-patch-repair endonuclease
MGPLAQTRRGRVDQVRDRERELSRLATLQHGVVAQRQLLALGYGERAIKVRLDAHRLRAIHREVYAVGCLRLSLHSRWLAAVLAYGDSALLSHRAGAALWGLSKPRSIPVDVTASAGRQGIHRRDGIWIHRGRLHPDDHAIEAGIPVTAVARTLFDLAEVVSFERLEDAWEEAERLKLLRLGELERVCERGHGRRALKPIRHLLAEARAVTRTRSPLEDRFQRFCRAYKLPPRHTNVEVLGREVDVLWPAANLIVELDSWAFQRDRARDTRLLVAGYRTIRVTHERLDAEHATLATELRQLLRQGAQSPPLDPASPPEP